MIESATISLDRRRFFRFSAGLTIAGLLARQSPAEEEQAVPALRAISGDVAEPAWKEYLTVTVGPNNADLVGTTDRALQAAVDYVARAGGGTVRVLPGTYRLRNAIYLPSRVRLTGSGEDSILVKEPSATAKLSVDADWYDREITLEKAGEFRVGDGICLRARDPERGGATVCKRTLVARNGNRFKLDRPLRENFWRTGEATAATLFPLLSGENIAETTVENLVLDGNRENNDALDGNHAGCLFLQDCNRITVRSVIARNYNGDGMSWQVCHDVAVEACHCHDNAGLGLHPGSGSQRSRIRGCRLERNKIGIFFCWGARFGAAESNTILESRECGVSLGHRDTDNVLRDNEIRGSGKAGVLFRAANKSDRGKDFAPHRNRLEGNRIVDNGPADGIGVDVQGEVEAIAMQNNEIHETRGPESRIGVRIGDRAKDIQMVDNRITGFSVAVADLRCR